ncbi:MarR family winged helix-turn-helix transcriptional regulator [Microbacterium kribbense]
MAVQTRDGTDQRFWNTSVSGDLAFLLARANSLSLAGANAALAQEGLKVRSYSVLALAASDERPTQRELSEFLRLDPSQIVALVDGLQRRGWVSREPDPQDRRVNVVVATDAGRAACERAHARVTEHQRGHFDMLTDDERALLTSLMRRLAGVAE